jgi:hypothetical protein
MKQPRDRDRRPRGVDCNEQCEAVGGPLDCTCTCLTVPCAQRHCAQHPCAQRHCGAGPFHAHAPFTGTPYDPGSELD